jgi:SLT domain-containing protein
MSRAVYYIAASALFFGLIQAHANGLAQPTVIVGNMGAEAAIAVMREHASQGFFEPRAVQNIKAEAGTAESDHTQSFAPTSAFDSVCQTLQSAAQLNDLPLEFLTRLIWQESRFDAHAISAAGARGIAQFMPGTAAWIGLANPFDAVDAITKSAELLRSLKSQFGNLGLAAAAYNAGPKRVADWLARRRGLPRETQAYVLIVTGHAPQEWITPADRMSLNLPDGVPCPHLAKLFANDRLETPKATVGRDKAKSAANRSATAQAPWGVQLIGGSSQISVLASYRQLQHKYGNVLGARQPLVIRSPVGRNASWYRVRIAAQTLAEAELLCGVLREAGGNCLVQKN